MSTSLLKQSTPRPTSYWFDHVLDPDACAKFRALLTAHSRHFEAGRLLKSDTDESHAIYVVMEGWVSISKSMPEGQTQIIDFGLPGDFFDLTSVDGATVAIGLETVTAATIAAVPVAEWQALERVVPQLAQVNQIEAAAIRSRIAERMLRLGRGKAEERLAYAFLELGIRTGAFHDDKIDCYYMPITQQQIGEFMGLTAVHVCRTLRRMARQGFVSTADHIDLCICDKAALEDLAGITAETLAHEIQH